MSRGISKTKAGNILMEYVVDYLMSDRGDFTEALCRLLGAGSGEYPPVCDLMRFGFALKKFETESALAETIGDRVLALADSLRTHSA